MGFYSLYRRHLKGGIMYYYRVNLPDGTRSFGHSTGEHTKTGAHTYCQTLIREGRLWSGNESTFRSYAENNHWFEKGRCGYLEDRLSEGTPERPALTDSTIRRYALDLREYLVPYLGNMKLRKIQPEHIRQFRVWMRQEKGLSPKSVNCAISVLRIMITWALDNHLIYYDPLRGIKAFKTEDNNRDAFTLEEAKMVLSRNWSNPGIWLYNLTAAVTGARLGEIRALRRTTIHPDYLNIVDQYQKGNLVPVKTKEKRKVPVTPSLWCIMHLFDKNSFTFCDSAGEPWKTHKVTGPLDGFIPPAMKRGRGLCFHSWRKFFNTWLLQENVTGEKIRAVMGHSSGPGMTEQVYAAWRPEIYPEVYAAQEKLLGILLDGNPMIDALVQEKPPSPGAPA
jgi:integrase